jgi:hypothetical protein
MPYGQLSKELREDNLSARGHSIWISPNHFTKDMGYMMQQQVAVCSARNALSYGFNAEQAGQLPGIVVSSEREPLPYGFLLPGPLTSVSVLGPTIPAWRTINNKRLAIISLRSIHTTAISKRSRIRILTLSSACRVTAFRRTDEGAEPVLTMTSSLWRLQLR